VTNKERTTLTDAHWDRVWRRLKAEGRVEVTSLTVPYCPSSCRGLDDWIKNPGATRNVRVKLQATYGDGGGDVR